MKRIISLIMSVLMIMTMFCGLAVTSNAAEEYGVVTPVYTDNGDGTYNVKWYFNDKSTGWCRLDIDFDWDDNLEVVTTTFAPKNDVAVVSIWNLYKFNTDLTAAAGTAINSVYGDLVYAGTGTNMFGAVIGIYDAGIRYANVETGDLTEPRASIELTTFGGTMAKYPLNLNTITMMGKTAADYEYDTELGFLLGEATLKLADGATSGVVSASVFTAEMSTSATNGTDLINVNDQITCNSVTIGTPAVEPEEPTMPKGITLEVQEGVAARTNDPAGMRFTTKVTADSWEGVTEMGTIIVKGADVALEDADVKLTIPARVTTDGKFIQDKVDGEFVDGVIVEDGEFYFTGVLSNIKDTNLNADFTAYAYIVVNGETYYSNGEVGNYSTIDAAAANDPLLG